MSFGLKNVEATYQQAMVALFHDMMNKEIDVYVDNMIVKFIFEEHFCQPNKAIWKVDEIQTQAKSS